MVGCASGLVLRTHPGLSHTGHCCQHLDGGEGVVCLTHKQVSWPEGQCGSSTIPGPLPQGYLSFLFSGRRWLPSHRFEAEGGHPAALFGARLTVTKVVAMMPVFWLCSPGRPHKCWDYELEPSQTELPPFLLKPLHVSPCLERGTTPTQALGWWALPAPWGMNRDAGRR